MLNWSGKRRALLLALSLCGVGASWACGMVYPETNALQELDGLADQVFGQMHAAILLEDYPNLAVPAFDEQSRWQKSGSLTTLEAEQQHLSEAELARVQAMRSATDATSSWDAGDGLSEELRLYTAGAWAFTRGDLPLAGERFNALRQLPKAQQQIRGSWAQYMLGRIALQQLRAAFAAAHTAGTVPAELNVAALRVQAEQVAALFAQVRDLVDPQTDVLLLGRSSWGEEAAAYLLVGNDLAATQRYLAQARSGSWSGRASLLMVARAIVRDEQRLRAALREPLLQALITALVISGPLDDAPDDPYFDPDDYPISFNLAQYLDALSGMPDQQVAGADRLAALAYRQGHYALATELLEHADTPLGWWTRGRLAERAGEPETAAQAYQRAEQLWLAQPQVYAQMPAQCGPQLDQAHLAASASETVKALLLLRATERFDRAMAGIAVLQLSTPQLRAYFDEHASIPQDNEDDVRNALGLRLLASGDADAALFIQNGQAKAVAAYLQDALQARERGEHVAAAQALFQAAQGTLELDGWQLSAALDPNPIEVDALGFERLRGPLTGVLSQRRVAADLANQAADQLAPGSQAYAAVLCHATGWLLARNPHTARLYHQRYQAHGKYFQWADDFGRQCPEPDFVQAAAPPAPVIGFQPCRQDQACFRYVAPRGVLDDRQRLLWAQREVEQVADVASARKACAQRGPHWRLPTVAELNGLRVPLLDESMRCGGDGAERCALPLWFQLRSSAVWTDVHDASGAEICQEPAAALLPPRCSGSLMGPMFHGSGVHHVPSQDADSRAGEGLGERTGFTLSGDRAQRGSRTEQGGFDLRNWSTADASLQHGALCVRGQLDNERN